MSKYLVNERGYDTVIGLQGPLERRHNIQFVGTGFSAYDSGTGTVVELLNTIGPQGATGPQGIQGLGGVGQINQIVYLNASPYNVSISNSASVNRAAIQQAIDDVMAVGSGTRGASLILAPGTYDIDDTIGISVTSDTVCKISFGGFFGVRDTVIRQTNDAVPLLQLKTTSGNIRDFDIHDIQLRGGTYGLFLQDDAYGTIRNVTFTINSPPLFIHRMEEVTLLPSSMIVGY